MAGSKDIVYIKADRNIEVTKPDVTLGDVLKMECSNPAVVPHLSTVKLLRFHHTDQKSQNRVAVSVLKVIEKNVSYDGGDYQPSPTHIKLVGSDGITYDYSSKTHSYSDDNIGLYNITLGKNTSKTYHIVFEVPSTTSLSKVIYASGYAKYIAGQDESLLS